MTPISLLAELVKKLQDRTLGFQAGKMTEGPTRHHSINPGFPHWVLQRQQCRGQFHLHLHLQATHREMLDFPQICQEHHLHRPHLQRSRFTKYKTRNLIPIIRQFPEVKDSPIPGKVRRRVLRPKWSTTPKLYIHHPRPSGKCRQHLNKVFHNIPQLLLRLPQAGLFRGSPSKFNGKASAAESQRTPLDYPASKALLQVTLT